ncbi:hypothetical protein EXU57_23910 [Segetibacter sp. 3557_3]|uniref:N-acetylmuramoyl-L-alanine amidase n=1 Tax=Segetibacter sp. 3557_3 TaxID=2547429 RepID=UPI00105911B0|nr:N-acetylmuramoyl-L-alanine amidase [Segetibacter sp. 3557_3]TDH18303.1 hypothetical protein EXU57_23910 [Segetibacter sp. 3557_3]
MLPVVYYFAKVLVCSALLYSYYFLALRNRQFHQYNRFYLLSTVFASWLIPLFKFDFLTTADAQPAVVNLLSIVASTDRFVEEQSTVGNRYAWNWELLLGTCVLLVSVFLLVRLLIASVRLYQLSRQNYSTKMNGIMVVFCRHRQAPFSVFNYVFWHEDIPLNSSEGAKILRHELAHVREKHSYDRLFLNFNLVVGWFNPMLWIINRELRMIHEFIADNKAISDGDTTAFSAMLLKATYPSHNFSITNNFFYSPIKRRLLMLTNSRNPRFSYLRRLSILPVLGAILFLFAFKMKQQTNNLGQTPLMQKYTVVLDPGHGGKDNGAMGVNEVKEKEIVLTISRMLAEELRNQNIQVVLTRNQDQFLTPQERVQLLSSSGANLFISIHANATNTTGKIKTDQKTGAEIVLAKKSNKHTTSSRLFGSLLSQHLQPLLQSKTPLTQKQTGIYVLDNQEVCPSILLECGYITNPSDMKMMQDQAARYAGLIANSIETYFSMIEKGVRTVSGEREHVDDSINETGTGEVRVAYKRERNKDTIPRDAQKRDTIIRVKNNGFVMSEQPLVILDGVEKDPKVFSLNEINPEDIKRIDIIKDKTALDIYGAKARNGVIIVSTKLKNETSVNGEQEKQFDKIFTRVENPPYYEAGMIAFANYVESNLQYPAEAIKNNIEGAVSIQFVVDTDGKLSNFKKVSDKGFGLEEEAIRLLKNSGTWKPGMQNGRSVPVQVIQQITFKNTARHS